MKTIAHTRLVRLRRTLAAIGTVALIATITLAIVSPAALRGAYRLAVFACLAPAIGSLWFALIHRTTGGQWGEALVPYFTAGARLAAWSGLLVLPLAWFAPESVSGWWHYSSRPMLVTRALIAALVILYFGCAVAKTRRRAWLGPIGLIVLVFTLHVLADDWLITPEADWHSTAFPLVWMTGQAVAGLACAVLLALAAGLSPSEPLTMPRALGLDLGNLLLAAMLIWAYVAFAQFLIIWAGNLPREISWYQQRTHGAWVIVPAVLAVIHFFLPLAVLLSRAFKRSRFMLGFAAALLLAGQLLYTAWLVLPAAPTAERFAGLLPIAAVAAALAFFFHRYVALASRSMAPA